MVYLNVIFFQTPSLVVVRKKDVMKEKGRDEEVEVQINDKWEPARLF